MFHVNIVSNCLLNFDLLNLILHVSVGKLMVSVFDKQTPLTKNRLVKTLVMLPKQFDISFDFRPTKWIGGWTSLLHLTTGTNAVRLPGIFPLNGKIMIQVTAQFTVWTPKLPLNKWVHFRLTQRLEGKNYVYRVYMNNKQLKAFVNKKPQDIKNVKVYVADPWYNAQPGFVRSVRVSGRFFIIYFYSQRHIIPSHKITFPGIACE